MSDKNFSLASGEQFFVRKHSKNKVLVKKSTEGKGSLHEQQLQVNAIDDKTFRVSAQLSETKKKNYWVYQSKSKRILAWPGGSIELDAQEYNETAGSGGGALKPLKLTMPGKVLQVKCTEGDIVEQGQGLVVVEAMKMENMLMAAARAKVSKIHVQPGDRLESGAVLVSFEGAE